MKPIAAKIQISFETSMYRLSDFVAESGLHYNLVEEMVFNDTYLLFRSSGLWRQFYLGCLI